MTTAIHEMTQPALYSIHVAVNSYIVKHIVTL